MTADCTQTAAVLPSPEKKQLKIQKKFQKTIPKYRKVCYNSSRAVQPHSDLRQNYQKRGF